MQRHKRRATAVISRTSNREKSNLFSRTIIQRQKTDLHALSIQSMNSRSSLNKIPYLSKQSKRRKKKAATLKDIFSKPTDSSGCFLNKLLFLDINHLFRVARKRLLTRRDIGSLPPKVRGKACLTRFKKCYFTSSQDTDHCSLKMAIFSYEKCKIITAIILRVACDIIQVSLPLVFRQLNFQLQNEDSSIYLVLMLVSIIPILIFIQDLIRQHSERYISEVKASTGQALRCFLFDTLVNSDLIFLKQADSSILSRLIFFELEHLLQFLHIVPSLISGPIALIFSGVLMVVELRRSMSMIYASTATFIQIALIIFILAYFNRRASQGRDRYSRILSEQALRLQELIGNIDIVKVNLFGTFFEKNLCDLRKKADLQLFAVHHSFGFIEFFLVMTPFIFGCMTVLINKVIFGTNVNAKVLFTVISMMIAVGVPLRVFSDGLKALNMNVIAYHCISKFFDNCVQKSNDESKPTHRNDPYLEQGEIKMEDCFFSQDYGWNVRALNQVFEVEPETIHKSYKNSEFVLVRSRKKQQTRVVPRKNLSQFKTAERRTVLKSVCVDIKHGEKICILSKSGAVSKRFFMAILEELRLEQGYFAKKGKVALLDMDCQKFLKGTIRENITLGKDFIPEKFAKICSVVGLNFRQQEGGQFKEIVEGQRNLTNEDKARILLARVLYLDADIILVNKYFDRLSRERQERVYNRVVNTYLAHKTVIFTSSLNLIVKQSDRVLVLDRGRIVEKGTYEQLIIKRKSLAYQIIMSDSSGSSNFFGKILEGLKIMPQESIVSDNFFSLSRASTLNTFYRTPQIQAKEMMDNVIDKWKDQRLDMITGKKLRQEEDSILKNSREAFKQILVSKKYFYMGALLLIFILTDSVLIGIQLWMAFWRSFYFDFSNETHLFVFIGLVTFASSCVVFREYAFTTLLLNNLSDNYVTSVKNMLNAPDEWFNQNSANRIAYILTKDQTVVDNDLLRAIFTLVDTCVITLIIFATLNIVYFGIFIIFSLIVGWLILSINRDFGRVSQRLIAFTTKSRAEMIDVYLDAFDNLTMLRHCGRADYYTDRFYQKTDDYQVATTNLYNKSMRWLNLRLSLFSIFLIVIITGLPVLSKTILFDIYLKQQWQFLYALGTASLLLASILNFSRYYPLTSLHHLSAQRIRRYLFELTAKPDMKEDRIKKQLKSPLQMLRRVAKSIARKKKRKQASQVSLLDDHHQQAAMMTAKGKPKQGQSRQDRLESGQFFIKVTSSECVEKTSKTLTGMTSLTDAPKKRERLKQLEMLREINQHASFSNLSPSREGGITNKVKYPGFFPPIHTLTCRKKAHLVRRLSH